jgi:hypothetical protein
MTKNIGFKYILLLIIFFTVLKCGNVSIVNAQVDNKNKGLKPKAQITKKLMKPAVPQKQNGKYNYKTIDYAIDYEEVVGFSEGDLNRQPIKESILFFKNSQEWGVFSKKYLRGLPIYGVVFKNKSTLFIQIPWKDKDPTTGYTYKIDKIVLKDKILTVTVKNNANQVSVDPVSPEYKFSYMIIATIDYQETGSKPKLLLEVKEAKKVNDK